MKLTFDYNVDLAIEIMRKAGTRLVQKYDGKIPYSWHMERLN